MSIEALRDAEKCITYNPDWAKGHLRLANALFGLGDYVGAGAGLRARVIHRS